MSLSTAQKNALNSGNPNALALAAGVGDLISDLQDAVASGNLSITAKPWDIDTLAPADRNVAHDADSDSGLTLGYFAGQIYVEGTGFVAVTAGTIALSASNTNYVEAASNGAVSKNTVGFTEGRVPLFIVVTGSSSITSVTPAKALLRCRPSTGLPGSVLSSAIKTKRQMVLKGTVSATGTVKIVCPNAAATITRISITVDTTVATDDTNYWTFTGVNKGPSGSGTTAVLDSSNTNTNKVTGGSAITAFIDRALALSGTPANLATAANDVLILSLTKTASAANLVELTVSVDFSIDG